MSEEKPLADIRNDIDEVDRKIVQLLAERWGLVRAAGVVKRDKQMAYWQKERVKEVLSSRAEWAEEHGVDVALVKDIFNLIVTSATESEQQGD